MNEIILNEITYKDQLKILNDLNKNLKYFN